MTQLLLHFYYYKTNVLSKNKSFIRTIPFARWYFNNNYKSNHAIESLTCVIERKMNNFSVREESFIYRRARSAQVLQLNLSKLHGRRFQPIHNPVRPVYRRLDTYTSCRRANHWIRLGGLDRSGRYVRDPAVILIERAHQSPKCNTHGPISRAQPLSRLPRPATHSPLTLFWHLSNARHRAHRTPRAASFFFFIHQQSPVASIISYASLNKSARTAITIDTACLPLLSSRRAGRSFLPFVSTGPRPEHTRTAITTPPGTGS